MVDKYIGDKLQLPGEYYEMIAALPADGVVVLGSPLAPKNAYAFVKNGVLVRIIDKQDLVTAKFALGEIDGVLANTDDIEGPLQEWMDQTKRRAN